MAAESVATALEREHHEIDDAIEAFTTGLAAGEHRPEPLLRALAALRRHIYLEERFLFPALREAGLIAPVIVMLREHGQLWRTMDTLEAQVGTAADDAIRKSCRELVVQLQHHNLKEERILYPQADQAVHGPAHVELTAFIESGQLPEGWVCERANAA